jgi:hypothetical protein
LTRGPLLAQQAKVPENANLIQVCLFPSLPCFRIQLIRLKRKPVRIVQKVFQVDPQSTLFGGLANCFVGYLVRF